MNEGKIAELEAASAAAKQAAEKAGGNDEALNKAAENAESALKQAKAPSQDGNSRTERDKAAFNLKKRAEEAKALGIDPAELLGIRPQIKLEDELQDDEPLTVGKFRQMQKQDAKKTALQMAEELPDDERESVLDILRNRLLASGNAEADLSLARAAVNSERNTKIAEELARRGKARQTAAGGSSNVIRDEDFEPTPEEVAFMRPPYNMPKEKIIEARKRAQKA